MGLVTRGTKPGTGSPTNFADSASQGQTQRMADLDVDLNVLYALADGAIDGANVSSIPRAKLDFGAGLVNADIAAAAAIVGTKLAAATVNRDRIGNNQTFRGITYVKQDTPADLALGGTETVVLEAASSGISPAGLAVILAISQGQFEQTSDGLMAIQSTLHLREGGTTATADGTVRATTTQNGLFVQVGARKTGDATAFTLIGLYVAPAVAARYKLCQSGLDLSAIYGGTLHSKVRLYNSALLVWEP